MTQSVESTDHRMVRPPPAKAWRTVGRATIATALLIAPFLSVRPLRAQGQGEVQVTAQVLPLVPTRQAALAFAADSGAVQPSHLFRITRVRRPEPLRGADLKREELIVVVEFLAN